MKTLSEMEELDLRCAFAEDKKCIFITFLLEQGWVPERCRNRAQVKKLFYKYLRDRDFAKYQKEFPDEN
jgi:hypothetical protein